MSNELANLQKQIEEALQLIRQQGALSLSPQQHANQMLPTVDPAFEEPNSLLEKCKAVCALYEQKKPTIRIIHHLACSGGTLVSKCISALPNVFLLSELHPTTRLGIQESKPSYTPRDVLTQAFYGKIPDFNQLAENVFLQNIVETEKHVRERGGSLVIRAHSHADYCTNAPLPMTDTITRLLKPKFEIKQLVTVRNPIDSFLSLRENGWVHFSPKTFDEYCRRVLIFIGSFDIKFIQKYEDFVANPREEIDKYVEALDLSKSDFTLEIFDLFKISGDSGRSGSEVAKRTRRTLEMNELKEFSKSSNFIKIQELLSYEI